jgi:dimethylamine corrinoid protein
MAEGTKSDVLLNELIDVIVACDAEGAKSKAEEVVRAGIDPVTALKVVLDKASLIVGQKFDDGEYFLPHLVMAGDAMTAMADVLEAAFPKGQASTKKTVVIATVEADLHSVG